MVLELRAGVGGADEMRLTSSRERQPQPQRLAEQVCTEECGDLVSQSRGGAGAGAGRADQADQGPRGSCQAWGLTYHECLKKAAISPLNVNAESASLLIPVSILHSA